MIDLFGMKRKPEGEPAPEKPAAEPPAPEAEPAPRGSHRLWAFLLVLDSVFVIVFGGAVAAKFYQYWKAPAVAAAPPVHRRPAPKAPEAVKPAEPAPAAAPAKSAAPVKSAEPAKPEPKAAARAEAPRPPKPSLLTEPPKPHEAPKPAAAAAAAPTAEGRSKALPVVFKLSAPGARSVQLVGAFIVHGGRKEMTKGEDGTWTVKLYLNPGLYRYFFSVDRKKQLDPENPRSDRGASVLSVP